jgi:hypothetical protein
MKLWMTAVLTGVFAVQTVAQLTVVSRQKLPLERTRQWSAPRFSADGKTIYFTTESNDGIWAYSSSSKTTTLITADRGAGFGFSVSSDGWQVAYRRTSYDSVSRRRVQEIIVADRATGWVRSLGAGPDLSTPVFLGDRVVFSRVAGTQEAVPDATPGSVTLLGIENTKIVLVRNGRREIFDPLGDGSYIWPVLSPGGGQIVACDMARGAFVWTIDGALQAKLGRRNAPAWTRDGRWIVYMDDRDDGHRLLSSDLYCVSADGKRAGRLTDTGSILEMYPSCSPTENKIAYSTLDGGIFVLEYRERGR